MNKIGLVLMATAAMTSAAHAKTVAWYHLGEGADGTRPAGGLPVILNAANTNALPAKAYQITGTKGPLSDTGNYLPNYAAAFPAGLTWKNPATGDRGQDGLGLHFSDSAGGADGKGTSSVVVVDNDSALRCPQVTVECMLKADAGLSAKWRDIVVMRNANGERAAWGIYGNGEGNVRVVMYSLDGTKTVDITSSTKTLFDGKWHHVAFTYDGTTVRLYFDYSLEKTAELAAGIGYATDSTGRLCLGSNDKESYGRWMGCIDELRISDEALDAAAFVRPAVIPAEGRASVVSDPDVFLYASFDSCFVSDSWMFGRVGAPFFENEASPSVAPKIEVYSSTDGQLPVASDDVASSNVHAGVLATGSKQDRASWYVGTSSAAPGKSFCVQIDDWSMNGNKHLVTGGDFTFETWFRCPAAPGRTSYFLTEGNTLAIRMNTAGDLVCDLVPESGSVTSISKAGLADNAWHHLALVSDRAAQTVTLFVDGAQVGQKTSFVLKSVDKSTLQLGGGWGRDTSREFENVYLDELRVTRRALTSQEFLAQGRAYAATDAVTRAFISFENDFAVGPQYGCVPDGTPTAAGAAIFSPRTPGCAFEGLAEGLPAENARSIAVEDTVRIDFGRNLLLERDMEEQTVEFFVKTPAGNAAAWSNVMGLFKNPKSDVPVWLVTFKNKAGELCLQARGASDAADQFLYFGSASEVGNGRWHHIAFVFQKADGGASTTVSCYRDYELASSQTLSGTLDFSSGNTMFSMARMPNNWGQFAGYIDGIRISKGVLTPARFLRARKQGLCVILR